MVEPDGRRDTYLSLAVALAFVAGCVDAVCFDRVFEVFPANQSGNAVLLGIALGHGRGAEAWRPAVAILGFAVGVAVGILLGRRVRHGRRAELLIGIELVMLAPVAIVVLADAHPAAELSGPASGILLVLTAGAMGLQTEIIGRVAGTAVATTYQTGAITRIAEAVTRRAPGDPGHPAVERGLVILLCVLVAYVGGAAAGAAMSDWSGSILVPMGVLVVCELALVGTARSRPPVT